MKTDNINPSEDLKAIRELMEKSSKFLSLSGLSGIFAGLCALIGAAVAWFMVLDGGQIKYEDFLRGAGDNSMSAIRYNITLIALLVLIFAALGALYFSMRKARKAGQKFWSRSTGRLLVHLLIPFITGGVFVLILAFRNNLDLVVPAMLIFYGLSLVNAGKFTFGEIHFLGLTEIGLGILAGIFTGHGLLFWAIGFGLMHIVYGTVMFLRYER